MQIRMRVEEISLIESQIKIRNEKIDIFNEGMIHSLLPASLINKQNKKFENLALDVRYLLTEDFDFYMELISLPQKNKSRSRLFVYGERLLYFMRSPMCKALKQVFTIIPIWPSVTPPLPTPLPMPDPSDYNLIPSNVKGECRPTLIIRPDDCKSEMGNQNYHRWLEGNSRIEGGNSRRHFEDPRVIFYGLILQPWWEHSEDPYSLELVRNYFNIEECFDSILERAIEAATNCLEKSDGEMNRNIIVQVKQKTVDNGFLKSGSYRRFNNAVKNLNKWYQYSGGVNLSLQII